MSLYYDQLFQDYQRLAGQGQQYAATPGDEGSVYYRSFDPSWNPYTLPLGDTSSLGLSGNDFNEANFLATMKGRIAQEGWDTTGATDDDIRSFLRIQGLDDPRQGGGIHDWAPLAQAVARSVAMYFGGPAAIAGSIAAGGATTAGASPTVSTAAGLAAGGLTSEGGVGVGADGTTSTPAGYGDAGYSGTAAGDSGLTQGLSGGGGGLGGGGIADNTGSFDQNASQGVFDSSGNPLNQQEPGMWDWLDSMDSGDQSLDLGDWGVDQGSSSADAVANSANDTGAFDQFGSMSGPNSDTSIFGGTADNPFGNMSLTDIISKYGSKGLDLVKSLLTRSAGAAGAPSSGSGILGNILNDPLSAAFDATPFLLALNEANKQSGDINSVLNGINGNAYTKAVLDPYDVDTGTGRASLQNDMALRGISGSSFGNTQLNNYDYTRALGRSDMATKAQLAAAQLQGSLINTRNTNKNLLLGAGLNASAKLFAPQQDPFNLKALLGA